MENECNHTIQLQLDKQYLKKAVIISFDFYEAISRCFHGKIHFLLDRNIIQPSQILGKAITVTIFFDNKKVRAFNGIASKLVRKNINGKNREEYFLEFKPSFHQLAYQRLSKSFCNKSLIEILQEYKQNHQLRYCNSNKLIREYPKFGYKVQYQESSYNFLRRLFSESGINYYFTHEENQHQMHLIDKVELFPEIHNSKGMLFEEAFASHKIFMPLQLQVCGYENREKSIVGPSKKIDSREENAKFKKESYCFLNSEMNFDSSMQQQYALEALCGGFQNENFYNTGQSKFLHLSAGYSIILNRKYLLTEIFHHWKLLDDQSQNQRLQYTNRYRCVVAKNPFSVKQYFKSKTVLGLQRGKVISKDVNKHWHTNQLTDVKVQLQWQSNAECTPFIPVKQLTTTQILAQQSVPLSDQEVMIAYKNNNLENPIVIGCWPQYGLNIFPKMAQYSKLTGYRYCLPTEDSDYSKGFQWFVSNEKENAMHSLRVYGNYYEVINNTIVESISGNSQQAVHDNCNIRINKGDYQLSVAQLQLEVGNSKLCLDSASIEMKAETIILDSNSSAQAKNLARDGDHYFCPKVSQKIPHRGGQLKATQNLVLVNGKAVICKDDQGFCPTEVDKVITNVASITINEKPIAGLGDKMKHGGKIVQSSNNVLLK